MIVLRTALIALSLSVAAPAFAFGAFPFLPNMTFPESTKAEVVTKQSSVSQTDKITNHSLQRDE